MTLKRQSANPLYEQIAEQLLAEIRQGDYGTDGKLPSEAELGQRFGVSRVTVRLALGRLCADGILQRRQGKGTYVAAQTVRHRLDALRSFHEALLLEGHEATMELLSVTQIPVPGHCRDLFPEQARCLEILRLHRVGGEPIAVGRSLLPLQLEDRDWHDDQQLPLYNILEQVTGQPIERADLTIGAVEAGTEVSTLLGVRRRAPLLVLERTSWNRAMQCCDRSTFHIRPERYSFSLAGVFRSR